LALEQEPGRADADFASMGTTLGLKNIIGEMHLIVVLVFKNLSPKQVLNYSCNMYRYATLDLDLQNNEEKHIVMHFLSFNSRRESKIFV
jgi:hypothetical protein